MKNKAYRDAAVAAHVSNTIAAQIATMRDSRGWTQTVLAEKAGMRQSRISVLEDPNFENVEVATLRRLASAFDVALTVRFVPFSELARWTSEMGEGTFSIPEFSHDALPAGEVPQILIPTTIATTANSVVTSAAVLAEWGETRSLLLRGYPGAPVTSSASTGLLVQGSGAWMGVDLLGAIETCPPIVTDVDRGVEAGAPPDRGPLLITGQVAYTPPEIASRPKLPDHRQLAAYRTLN